MRMILIIGCCLACIYSAMTQSQNQFQDWSRSETRTFLLSQDVSEAARDYVQQHNKLRKVANGFLVTSGVFTALTVVTVNGANNQESVLGTFVYGVASIALGATAGVSLLTSCILRGSANKKLKQAQTVYLEVSPTRENPGMGLILHF